MRECVRMCAHVHMHTPNHLVIASTTNTGHLAPMGEAPLLCCSCQYEEECNKGRPFDVICDMLRGAAPGVSTKALTNHGSHLVAVKALAFDTGCSASDTNTFDALTSHYNKSCGQLRKAHEQEAVESKVPHVRGHVDQHAIRLR